MTIWQSLVGFTLAAGLLTVTPGLDTALVVRTGAVEGRRQAMLAAAGICLGCLVWGVLASVGLGALLAASATAFDALRLVGACYLLFLGCRLFLRAGRELPAGDGAEPVASRGRERAPRWFVRGLLTNLLNPKVGLFYVTFLPQFLPAGVPVTAYSVLLASIHAAEGMAWFAGLTLGVGFAGRWLRSPVVSGWLDRATGAVLLAVGVRLLIAERR